MATQQERLQEWRHVAGETIRRSVRRNKRYVSTATPHLQSVDRPDGQETQPSRQPTEITWRFLSREARQRGRERTRSARHMAQGRKRIR